MAWRLALYAPSATHQPEPLRQEERRADTANPMPTSGHDADAVEEWPLQVPRRRADDVNRREAPSTMPDCIDQKMRLSGAPIARGAA